MVTYSDWMKDIGDDTSLARLSVPGTHNLAACHMALPLVQCQGESVTDQLKHGVRFLDIRVAKPFLDTEGDKQYNLQVIHGKFPVKIPFLEKLSLVLDEVYDFLQDHSGETVVVLLKQEGPDNWDNDNDEFPNCIWDRYVNPRKDKWYLGTTIPSLRDARGKVVLFRRFGVKNEQRNNEFGINAGWLYNTQDDDRGIVRVQDFCELNLLEDIVTKAGYVKNLLDAAKLYNSSNSDPKLFLNFCSGANFFNTDCWPEKVAVAMEKQNIQDTFGKGCGIVVLDYCERDNYRMVKELVDKNF